MFDGLEDVKLSHGTQSTEIGHHSLELVKFSMMREASDKSFEKFLLA